MPAYSAPSTAEIFRSINGAPATLGFFAVYRKIMSEYTEAGQRKVFHHT
jgi:hypothetical protein